MNAVIYVRTFSQKQPLPFLLIAGAIWFGLYLLLIPLSESLVAALPVDRNSHLGGALQFFF
ncbi:MAG: permease, partial [Tolumonas sp.]|nr:permease [Tolumonas sp.]